MTTREAELSDCRRPMLKRHHEDQHIHDAGDISRRQIISPVRLDTTGSWPIKQRRAFFRATRILQRICVA